jgi:glycosyltransferase involved in cell wall biosynthesis
VAAADAVVTPSSEQAQRLQRLYGREAVLVRTASLVAEETTDEGGDSAAQARRDGRPTVLGYLGVIGEQDGVGDLVEAIDMLRGRGVTGFRLVVGGDGPALAGVREQVARRGLGDLVEIRGWLGPTQIGPFFDEIDAMTVPDPDIEFNHYCAMNKVTHAMARGIPVVLRPLRENSRLVADAGLLAKDMSLAAFADALETVIGFSDKERAVIGERLREIFEAELSWGPSAERYLAAASPARHGLQHG